MEYLNISHPSILLLGMSTAHPLSAGAAAPSLPAPGGSLTLEGIRATPAMNDDAGAAAMLMNSTISLVIFYRPTLPRRFGTMLGFPRMSRFTRIHIDLSDLPGMMAISET